MRMRCTSLNAQRPRNNEQIKRNSVFLIIDHCSLIIDLGAEILQASAQEAPTELGGRSCVSQCDHIFYSLLIKQSVSLFISTRSRYHQNQRLYNWLGRYTYNWLGHYTYRFRKTAPSAKPSLPLSWKSAPLQFAGALWHLHNQPGRFNVPIGKSTTVSFPSSN